MTRRAGARLTLLCGAALVAAAVARSEPSGGTWITDQAGRKVKVPEKVERVVSLFPGTTCLLYVLGAEEMVVGIDDRVCEGPVLPKVWPGVRRLPVVGTISSNVNKEQLLALRPDIVFLSHRRRDLAAEITKMGLTAACFGNYRKLDYFLEQITLIGRCVRRERQAAGLRRFIERKMAEVEAAVARIPRQRRPRVYVTFPWDPLRTTRLDRIERAGGINIAPGRPEVWYTVDMEWLLARDPDVILEHALGKYDLAKMGGGWSSVRAVREGRMYRVYIGYIGMDPAGYLFSVRQMAALFHRLDTPWAEDMAADGRAIFARVYGRPDVFDAIAREMNLTLTQPRGKGR